MGPVTQFILRRIAIGLVTIWVTSIISFAIIELPPGDFASSYVAQLSASGAVGSERDIRRLRADYGLDQPIYVRYGDWVRNMFHGDFGRSLVWGRPVGDLIGERMGLTVALSLGALLLSWILALPVGVYCAAHKGSFTDFLLSGLSLMGVAIPNFLLALMAIYVAFRYFNKDLGELESPTYVGAPGSLGKIADFIAHIFVPAFVLALPSAARLVRILRANLLDELSRPYVVTARAKGMREFAMILKYPTRIALNPFVSTIGVTLPQLISGSVLISLVMSLPTVGPLLLQALQSQDLYLASTILLVLSSLTVAGTLLADLALVWLDPRIGLDQ